MELYIDLEWLSHTQKIILAGFYIPKRLKKQLYDDTLTKEEFLKILKLLDPEKDLIIFHGPDIGYLEKLFKIELREKYLCINFQKILREYTRFKLISLKRLEGLFKIKRTTKVLEHHEIRRFWKYGGSAKQKVLWYNMDDIINLYQLKEIICKRYEISYEDLVSCRLTHNASSRQNRKKYKY